MLIVRGGALQWGGARNWFSRSGLRPSVAARAEFSRAPAYRLWFPSSREHLRKRHDEPYNAADIAAPDRFRPRTHRTPPAAAHAQRPSGRSNGACPSAGFADRPAAPARPAHRASASHSGSLRASLRRASRCVGAGDEACFDRGLRGRDLLRPFRRGEGGRHAAACGDGPGLRFIVLRACGRGTACSPI